MEHKLCVITGANSGIGFEAAKALAGQGAFVVMVCRNEEKARRAQQQIEHEIPGAGIDLILCDFAIQADIRDAAQTIRQKYDQVDVLINNHGFIPAERKETIDGFEEAFAVNHLGYFLFTRLLLPSLQKANQSRIINVASTAHRRGTFNPDNLQLQTGYSPAKAYANSKLFNILFTKELAQRVAHTDITANCMHPGVVATNFGKESRWYIRLVYKLLQPFLRSPKQGADTIVYLAESPEIAQVNGAYFIDRTPKAPSAAAQNKKNAAKLWSISSELCGLTNELSLNQN